MATIFISGCADVSSFLNKDYDVYKISYDDIPWDDEEDDITDEIKITIPMAQELAEVYYNETGLINRYEPSFSTEKNGDIVIISWGPTDKQQLGGDFNMAIDARTCRMIGTWGGE